jgi:hypothetical protein
MCLEFREKIFSGMSAPSKLAGVPKENFAKKRIMRLHAAMKV